LIIPETADRYIPRPLSEEHRRMLERESAISPDVLAERGYFTAARRSEVPLIFTKEYQRRRGLVIPTLAPDGETESYRLRPDTPRRDKKNKPIKYETPTGASNILDVGTWRNLERVRDRLRDLWIVEGEKKADSLVSRGEAAIAIPGVWSWLRDGEPLPCWQHVPLEGRTVYVAYDSDCATNPNVALALERLVGFLKGHGARIQVVYLPEVDDA
jgi:Domain of unknown function (DUF3854)